MTSVRRRPSTAFGRPLLGFTTLRRRAGSACIAAAACTLGAAAALADSASPAPLPPQTVIASIDLARLFNARSAWRFTATQGPSIADPSQDDLPGLVTLCLRRAAAEPCDPLLQAPLPAATADSLFTERHFLDQAAVVQPPGGSGPFLLVATASIHSGDGDQLVLTQALAYQPGADRFVLAYEHATGRNNNQEVRYIGSGALAGDIVAVDPADAPRYGYWVRVDAPTRAQGYRTVLRFRSATAYGDGNALSVIDSEMVNIQQRLGLWRPGSALPLPTAPCPRPHLIRMELWCE